MSTLFELISKSLNRLNSMGDLDPDEKVIQALKLALEATTPDHPGNPWESRGHRSNQNEQDEWI